MLLRRLGLTKASQDKNQNAETKPGVKDQLGSMQVESLEEPTQLPLTGAQDLRKSDLVKARITGIREHPISKLQDSENEADYSSEDSTEESSVVKHLRERRVFAPATFAISGGSNSRHSRKCAMCGRPLRADRAAWTRRVGGGLWTKDHPNLAKTLSEENPVDPARDKEFERCLTCARSREKDDVVAMAAHRKLPVLTGVDRVEYPDGSIYIGESEAMYSEAERG